MKAIFANSKRLQNLLKPKYKIPFFSFSSFINFKSPTNDSISRFLQDNNLVYKTRASGQIVVEKCPLCPKPHKDQTTNMWTLNFKQNNGAFLCFRCGVHGSWTDFVRKIIGNEFNMSGNDNFNTQPEQETTSRTDFIDFYKKKLTNFERLKENKTNTNNKENKDDCHEHGSCDHVREEGKNKDLLNYITGPYPGRAISMETLSRYGVGIGEEMFKNDSGNYSLVPSIYFPMVGKEFKKRNEDWLVMKTKIRGIFPNQKKHQRIFPPGSPFGLFGLNTLLDCSSKKAVVITEGEYDAMAVGQATGLPSISLPSGASSLPFELLRYLEDVERIYLWMDFDEVGQLNTEQFADKLGLSRCYIVKELTETELQPFLLDADLDIQVKDANDALRVSPKLVNKFLEKARAIPQSQLVRFSDLRSLVKERVFNIDKYKGVPSGFFPWFNKTTKGFRRGEWVY